MRTVGTVGLSFPPTRFVLGERLSVVNFARALEICDPIFTSVGEARARGHAGRPVPPTMYAFFHTVANQQVEEELGFEWGRTLGAGMNFEAGRVAGEEEEVVGQSQVEDAWETSRGDSVRQFLRLRTDFSRPDGELVCRWRALFVERHVGEADGRAATEPSAQPPDVVIAGRSHEPTQRLSAPVGQELPGRRFGPIDRLLLARVSIAIDNPDPLHIDDAVAQASGFPMVLGQGSAAAGVLYETVRDWCGLSRLISGSIRMLAPYSLGAELTSAGSVADVERTGERAFATCDVTLTDATGAVIATGSFRVDVS